jgi:hypothetical protein
VIMTEGRQAEPLLAAFDQIVDVLDLELNGRQARAQVAPSQRTFIDVLARPRELIDDAPTVHPLTMLIAFLGLGAAGGAGALVRRRKLDEPPSRTELRPTLVTTSPGSWVASRGWRHNDTGRGSGWAD